MVEDKILDADGILIVAPVYSVGIVGQLKNITDRFGAAHDRASMIDEQEKRKADGRPLLDERYFKDRWVSYIAVGGAWTPDWTGMGLPMMHLFSCSQAMKVVGQINANDQGRKTSPFLDPPMMVFLARFTSSTGNTIFILPSASSTFPWLPQTAQVTVSVPSTVIMFRWQVGHVPSSPNQVVSS